MSHCTHEHLNSHAQAPYGQGCQARETRQNKTPPGALNWRDRHYWLAGWNDRDLELRQA